MSWQAWPSRPTRREPTKKARLCTPPPGVSGFHLQLCAHGTQGRQRVAHVAGLVVVALRWRRRWLLFIALLGRRPLRPVGDAIDGDAGIFDALIERQLALLYSCTCLFVSSSA
jgi:hypothetical protein